MRRRERWHCASGRRIKRWLGVTALSCLERRCSTSTPSPTRRARPWTMAIQRSKSWSRHNKLQQALWARLPSNVLLKQTRATFLRALCTRQASSLRLRATATGTRRRGRRFQSFRRPRIACHLDALLRRGASTSIAWRLRSHHIVNRKLLPHLLIGGSDRPRQLLQWWRPIGHREAAWRHRTQICLIKFIAEDRSKILYCEA
mmetsp:Transcript_11120/g.32504  ORF Transcript_11120/g.32504 Transcript_11120/m.32504 type:complete len:202 (+) Transcript_11120:1657-2262(+)